MTAFRKGRMWRSGRIYSDEGFSLNLGARDSVAYFEGNSEDDYTGAGRAMGFMKRRLDVGDDDTTGQER